MKSPGKLGRMLDWAPPMKATEFCGLLMGSLESPTMPMKMSETILGAVIKFTAGTAAHHNFPQYWGLMKDTFDALFANCWKKRSPTEFRG